MTLYELTDLLYNNPEESLKEDNTKKIISDFITNNTKLIIHQYKHSLYAVKYGNNKKRIGIRAEMDAVYCNNEYRHLCGHNGHMAILCGIALELDKKIFDNNVYLIFQSAEEIGKGAKELKELIEELNLDELYGFHNVPGFEEGSILLKKGVFALESCGISLKFRGIPTHAANPELGINPSYAIANVINNIKEINDFEELNYATIVGSRIGGQNYGMSAYLGQLYLTIRSKSHYEFEILRKKIIQLANTQSSKENLEFEYEIFDYFPITSNDDELYKKLNRIDGFDIINLKEPFKWSEDFGYYSCKKFMIGLGNGYSSNLHTIDYQFNKGIILNSIKFFIRIIGE